MKSVGCGEQVSSHRPLSMALPRAWLVCSCPGQALCVRRRLSYSVGCGHCPEAHLLASDLESTARRVRMPWWPQLIQPPHLV